MLERFCCACVMLTGLVLASLLPTTAGAHPPAYITQWGSYGSGNGQSGWPYGVATDPTGNVYVSDEFGTAYPHIQKSGPATTPTVQSTWGRIKALYR